MDPVLQVVERSNQRGGRMLSVIDLIEAGTLTREQVCRLLARIEQGSSWLVGAKPGGAGKTAVTSALLAMLPAGETVRLTNPGTGWEDSRPGECVVAYEIGRGAYDAYISDEDVARMAALGRNGCRIVTNLHADTLEQARDQVVNDHGVPEEDFNAFDMFLPVSVEGGPLSTKRTVKRIHRFENGEWRALDAGGRAPSDREAALGEFLDKCVADGLRTIGDVRTVYLAGY